MYLPPHPSLAPVPDIGRYPDTGGHPDVARYPDVGPGIRIPADIRISASNPYPPKSGCDGGLADGYPYPYPSRISGFPYPAESFSGDRCRQKVEVSR